MDISLSTVYMRKSLTLGENEQDGVRLRWQTRYTIFSEISRLRLSLDLDI